MPVTAQSDAAAAMNNAVVVLRKSNFAVWTIRKINNSDYYT